MLKAFKRKHLVANQPTTTLMVRRDIMRRTRAKTTWRSTSSRSGCSRVLKWIWDVLKRWKKLKVWLPVTSLRTKSTLRRSYYWLWGRIIWAFILPVSFSDRDQNPNPDVANFSRRIRYGLAMCEQFRLGKFLQVRITSAERGRSGLQSVAAVDWRADPRAQVES